MIHKNQIELLRSELHEARFQLRVCSDYYGRELILKRIVELKRELTPKG